MIVDHQNDGHPIYAIPPGSTCHYSFPINQRAALNWYHPLADDVFAESSTMTDELELLAGLEVAS